MKTNVSTFRTLALSSTTVLAQESTDAVGQIQKNDAAARELSSQVGSLASFRLSVSEELFLLDLDRDETVPRRRRRCLPLHAEDRGARRSETALPSSPGSRRVFRIGRVMALRTRNLSPSSASRVSSPRWPTVRSGKPR